jgi:hypothetical protein
MKTEGAETAINRSILKTVPLQLTGYSLKCGAAVHRSDQREGMGLLEYHPIPSLRGVAHDGWLCTFTISEKYFNLSRF